MNWIVLAVLAGLIAAFIVIRGLSILRIRQHISGLKRRQAEQFDDEAVAAEKEAHRLAAELHLVKSIYRNKSVVGQVRQEKQSSIPV